jgi:hypothetical protein
VKDHFNAQDGGRANLAIGGGAIEGEDLGTREGFNRPLIPVSELPKDQKKFINNWLKNNPDKTWEDLTSLQRNDLKKGKNVGVGYGGTTPKGVDNPAFQPLSEKGKKIAQHVYGTTDISDDKRYRINRGEITMDTKPVKFEKGKDISVKMKRGANIADDVIFPNEQMKKDFIKAIKARVQQPEKAVVDFSNKELAKLFPISEKQAGRAAQYFIKDLGLEYAKVKTKTASEIIKNTKNLIKQTSSFLEENRIRSAKTNILEELDLQKKMDTAHRVSKTHMAKLGLEFNTDIMGIDSRLINQIIVKPSEVQLDRLYRKQYDIFEKLKKNPDSIELKNNLKNINKEVTDIVKSTSGRLVGVTIDPDTLETSFQGIKKKYSFSNVLGDSMTMKELENIPKEDQVKFLTKQLPKAIDLEVKRGFVPNDFKNILSNPNSQKAILKYAKQKAPELINPLKKAFLNPDSKASLKLFSSFPAITTAGLVGLGIYKGMGFDQEARADEVLPSEGSVLPGAAAAGTAGAGYALRKPLTKFGKYALQVAGTPLGATGLIAGFGIDPKKAMDRVGIEAELALAPELVKQSAKFSPAVQRILNFGLSPTMAARAARIASPIGIASLGGEALYKYGKFVKDELDRIEQMSLEEREAYNISEQEQMGVAAADGGIIRLGFADGPPDPSKRKFVKTMAGLASLPIFGKFLKPATKAIEAGAPVAEKAVTEAEKIFFNLVDAVKNKGIMDKLDRVTGGRLSGAYHKYKDAEVLEDAGSITARFKTDTGAPAEIVYIKPQKRIDPKTGKEVEYPGQFDYEAQEIGRMNPEGDVDIDAEFEIIDSLEDVKKLIDD